MAAVCCFGTLVPTYSVYGATDTQHTVRAFFIFIIIIIIIIIII